MQLTNTSELRVAKKILLKFRLLLQLLKLTKDLSMTHKREIQGVVVKDQVIKQLLF